MNPIRFIHNQHEAIRTLLAVLVIAGGVAACGVQGEKEGEDFSGERAYQLVAEQVGLGPRPPGSQANAETRAWIAASLQDRGWLVRSQSFDYHGTALVNVVGERGQGPLIVLGAHYDTRPVADQEQGPDPGPVLGANDGASGVAVLLELARVVNAGSLACRLELAFFDGEDSGDLAGWDWIVGSTHYAQSLADSPQGVVVVDMVGDRSLQLPRERNSDPGLQDEIYAVAAGLGYQHAFLDEPGYRMLDDHTPFLDLGMPAVDIIDFDYPAWHTTQDDLTQVSAASLRIVGHTLQSWLAQRCG
jgi:glutaminyl-peptide cyclotransferase